MSSIMVITSQAIAPRNLRADSPKGKNKQGCSVTAHPSPSHHEASWGDTSVTCQRSVKLNRKTSCHVGNRCRVDTTTPFGKPHAKTALTEGPLHACACVVEGMQGMTMEWEHVTSMRADSLPTIRNVRVSSPGTSTHSYKLKKRKDRITHQGPSEPNVL